MLFSRLLTKKIPQLNVSPALSECDMWGRGVVCGPELPDFTAGEIGQPHITPHINAGITMNHRLWRLVSR